MSAYCPRYAVAARADLGGVPGRPAAGGAIVFAVLFSGTGTAVASGLKHAVCKIMQQTDCASGTPEPPGDPGVGDSDLDGPSLTDHPLPVLPFPGSVTVSCTYDERDPQKCVPHGGPGVSVQASGEIKVERTPTSLDANGCPWQNLSLADQAPAQRQRRGQGRQGRRLAVRLPRPVDELPGHRRRPTRPTTSPTATARRPTRSTRRRSRRARASSSPRTSTRASTPRAPTARSSSRWATTKATACPAASSASARRRCG